MYLGLNNRRIPNGFTLIDVMGSVLIIALAVTGVIFANGRAMSTLKAAKQAAVASKCLQQRIEQIRTYNYTEVTDATAMQNLYASPPLPSVELTGFSEQVTVSAFNPSTAAATSGTPWPASAAPVAPYIQITRDSSGAVTLVSDNKTLVSGPEVRVDVQISWPGPNGVTRMRQTSVVVANGGVGR